MGQDPNEKQAVSMQSWIIVLLCGLAMFQNTYISIAPAVSAYTIAGTLGDINQHMWIVQAQGIPSIATGPIIAVITDVYGRRYAVLGTWLLFCVAAIICMLATNVNQVIAGQALAGVCAGISGTVLAITSEVVPSIYRSHVQTWVNWFSGFGAIVALLPITAAVNNDPINGWRWVFRMQLIINGVLLVGFAALYFPPARTATFATFRQKIKSLDWIGYFLLFAGLIPLLMGFAWASDSNYGWSSPYAYAPVSVGFVMFLATLLYEWKGTSRGFMDHRLFDQGRNFPTALFIMSVEGSLFYLINNIYSAQANGLWASAGSMEACARILPFYVVVTIVSPFMSIYVTHRKDVKWPLAAGFTFFSVCIIGLACSGTNSNMATAFDAVGGLGFAAPLILVMTIVQLSTPPLYIGVASALTISCRTLGGVVGYAIAEGIYGSRTNTQIPQAIAEAVAPLGFDMDKLGALIGALESGTGISDFSNQIIGAASVAMTQVEVHGYKITWLAFLPGTVLAAIACIFLQNPTDRMNWVVDAPLEVDVLHLQDSEKADGAAEREEIENKAEN
ncbi:major facilitator superfamily domain-containing protein [Xylariales sp. PMI_506]|nr:major facilitator superfamily domain-containing protein [Xylariales sp. PMI_506]